MGKKNKGKKDGGAKPVAASDESEEELAEGVAGVELGGAPKGGAAAPFSFNPAAKGQAPASAGNFSFAPGGAGAAPAFSFPQGGGEGGGNAAFSFNFAQGGGGANAGGESGEEEEEGDDVDHVEEFIKSLPEPVQACVKELSKYDEEISELEKGFRKELRDLERKYEALYTPIHGKREGVVTGKTVELSEGKGDGSGVPDFWLTAMNNCMVVASNITEKDEVILKSLTNIESATLPEEEGVGFKLEFTFATNEFFTNTKLTKVYHMADSGEDPVLEKAEGTEIDWHQGKNVTVKIKKKKQRNKNGKGTRVVTKTEPCESFFNFFSPPKIPGPEDEDMEGEELEHRQMELESDYEMGIAFQERIVPHAIKWFTGEAEDDDMDSEGEYDMEDMEDMDDDEDDDDDDDDHAPSRPRGHGGRGGHRGGRGGGRGGGGR